MADTEKLEEFSKKYGVDGLRTFLVTADDASLRERVFEFARSVPKENAEKIFAAYGELTGSIDTVGDYLQEQFGTENTGAVEQIVEKQLDRARNLLSMAHEFKNDPERLLSLVECVRADTQLFLDSCRTLRQQGALSLENIRDGSLEIHAGDINEQDASAILNIQAERYREKYPEAMQRELRENLSDALKSPHSRFYLYRKNSEIVTYVRFDDLTASGDSQHSHMGSFMTNPKFEGGSLGQAMLEVALKKEIEGGQSLYAECDPSLVPFYEKYGFRLLRSYKDNYGVDTCDIVLEPESESLREAA